MQTKIEDGVMTMAMMMIQMRSIHIEQAFREGKSWITVGLLFFWVRHKFCQKKLCRNFEKVPLHRLMGFVTIYWGTFPKQGVSRIFVSRERKNKFIFAEQQFLSALGSHPLKNLRTDHGRFHTYLLIRYPKTDFFLIMG